MPRRNFIVFTNNNIEIRFPVDFSLSLQKIHIPLAISLFHDTAAVKAINKHMLDIYSQFNGNHFPLNLTIWQLLLYRFFLDMLKYGRKNRILDYKLYSNIIIIDVFDAKKCLDLFNNAHEQIVKIIDKPNNDSITKTEAVDKVYNLLDTQKKLYKSNISNLENNDKNIAKQIKRMTADIRTIFKGEDSKNGRHSLIVRPLFLTFLVFSIVIMILLFFATHFIGFAGIFALMQNNISFTVGVSLFGALLLSIISTGFFGMVNKAKEAKKMTISPFIEDRMIIGNRMTDACFKKETENDLNENIEECKNPSDDLNANISNDGSNDDKSGDENKSMSGIQNKDSVKLEKQEDQKNKEQNSANFKEKNKEEQKTSLNDASYLPVASQKEQNPNVVELSNATSEKLNNTSEKLNIPA